MKIVDGKTLADEVLNNLASKIDKANPPSLAILQVGNEIASNVYVANKKKAAAQLGIKVNVYPFETPDEEAITQTLNRLNIDRSVHGIIIQLPTPGIVSDKLLNIIDAAKDVDGLTSLNLGNVWHSLNISNLGATPKAILFVLDYIAKQENSLLVNFLQGKNIVVVNHSVLIGKPLSASLVNFNSTVTICNSYTKNLNTFLTNADIIVSATGSPIITYMNAKQLKSGVIIIDSGYRLEQGISVGDVDTESVKDVASWLSPVPGGVGPLGVAMLMRNTYERSIARA